jgi:phosphoribosylaminoimidazole-succinocarboxamide synthase
MTDEYCQSVADRYIELYEEITGTTFERATDVDLAARIERNVTQWLKDN